MHIVIAGAGFAGLSLARSLNNRKGIKVTLLDRFNFHQFQPLFYQVATGGLDASNISFPLRKIFQNSANVSVHLCEVIKIQPDRNLVIGESLVLPYDILVVATGCRTNFFGNENIRRFALPMKSSLDAIDIRNRLLQNLEAASKSVEKRNSDHLKNIVVVGGGPTGVELSGALAELKRDILPKDYPELDLSKMNIYLLEKSDRLLTTMSKKSGWQSESYLTSMGVKVLCKQTVLDFDGTTVFLESGKRVRTCLLIWTAGVTGNIPEGIPDTCVHTQGRLIVDSFNRVPGFKNIFAIGDICIQTEGNWKNGHPQVCKVAIDQAGHLAANIIRQQSGLQMIDFHYKDRGTMATVGRHKALVDFFPFKKSHWKGWFAWMIWMTFHLYQLLGVKNKIQVFINWIYHYFTYDQNLRLIFKKNEKHFQADKNEETTALKNNY